MEAPVVGGGLRVLTVPDPMRLRPPAVGLVGSPRGAR
ncbi:MAG: hypothetical protein XXXNARYT_001878 [Candidatus Accumulibacter regalis]